jgi:hypothetical protein
MPFNVGGEIWSGAMSTVSGRNSGICKRGLRVHMDSGIKESYPGTGTTWYDLTENENNGTMNGPTFSNGDMNFDGTDDYVNIGAPSSLSLGASGAGVTVEAWVYAQSNSDSYASIFGSGQIGDTTHSRYIIGYTGTSKVFRCDVSNGSFRPEIQYTFNSWNSWYHIVATWNGTKTRDGFGLYVNNDRAVASEHPTYTSIGTYKTWRIGTDKYGVDQGGRRFTGKINIVRGYARGFTKEDVSKNFNAERSRFGV